MTDPTQLLAMAAAGRTEELRTAVMQQLAGQEGLDPAVQSLLSQSLAARGEDSDDGAGDTDRDDLDRLDPDRDDRGPAGPGSHDPEASRRRRRALWLLRERFADMQVELAELRERNDALAAALGACALCWGADPACDVCAGRGGSGRRPPQPAMFDYFVAPALRRRHDVHRHGSSVPRSRPVI
jgi:hypothetical protein